MESEKLTNVIITDFSKAFVSVLIAKLSLYGITESLLSWLRSYLIVRFQQVQINGFLSDILPVPSGIPQGGQLSSLLFEIFILDIGVYFKYCITNYLLTISKYVVMY